MTERLGLGPMSASSAIRRLVYGRVTGWGQEGPLAHAAGHDINYIALVGAARLRAPRATADSALEPDRRFRRRWLYLAFGVVCGILEAQRSGQGQVVDAAMVDGTAR